jgi:hypothetical protein
METIIQEFKLNDNTVKLTRINEHSDYVVKYLTNYGSGFTIFSNLKMAKRFYNQIETTIVENCILEKICSLQQTEF